jgi:DNA gyrase subunit A
VYDTMVRMAQPFSLRYLLVDGQGNFGSVDGDAAAAMRYTEVRMSRLAHELLADIDKETVDFQPNYDEKEHEPSVCPPVFPTCWSTARPASRSAWPPTFRRTTSGGDRALLALIDDPELGIDGLMQYVPGPDFPTAGIINGSAGITRPTAPGAAAS